MEIVDAHQHVGSLGDALSWSGTETGRDLPVAEDAALRIAAMDAVGVDWAVLQPSHGYRRSRGLQDTMDVNDHMAAFRRQGPERFRAVLGTVEPMHGADGLPEVDRCRFELALDGLSWHHRFQGCYVDSRWMWPILEHMAEHAMVAAVHVNAESSLEAPWRLQRLARDFPEVSFLAFDGLWSYERARQILDTASQTPNVVWDIGGPAGYVGIEEWVRRNGARTVCFSAELAYGGSGAQRPKLLDQIERADITDDERADILGGNLRRMFGLADPA